VAAGGGASGVAGACWVLSLVDDLLQPANRPMEAQSKQARMIFFIGEENFP